MAKNLSDNDFQYLSQELSGDLLELVKQKRVYPYEYVDSFEKFSEDKLPDRCNFFLFVQNMNILVKNTISTLLMFGMHLIGDNHDLCLKTDILLLADVFEFIGTCLEYYRYDPCNYLSSPRLSWDAMLKITGIE